MPAVGLNDLPEDCFVAIKKVFNGYSIDYVDNNHIFYKVNGKFLGGVVINLDKTNVTKKIYTVGWAQALKGYGPLLYSVAMELVNEITNGKGYLKSDPAGVSTDAERVWNYFDQKDPTVQKKQLDSLQNELTPTKIDNVDQTFPREEYKSKWSNSALSRGFAKRSNSLLNHPKVITISSPHIPGDDHFIKENKVKIIRIKNVKK